MTVNPSTVIKYQTGRISLGVILWGGLAMVASFFFFTPSIFADNPPLFCRLELIKEVDRTTAQPGDILTYTIRIANTGTAFCTGGGVHIQDVVDPNLEFISETHSPLSVPNPPPWGMAAGYLCPPGSDPCVGSPFPPYDSASRTLNWSGHDMPPGVVGTITWTARVLATQCGTTIINNQARATANEYFGQWVTSNLVQTTVNNSCQPTLIVRKHVINDNGGTLVAGDFTMQVSATNPSPATFPGSETGVAVTVEPGNYTIDELPQSGYHKSLSAECAGSIALGEIKTCTITNNDQPPVLTLLKQVINDNGGSAQASDWVLMAVGGSTPLIGTSGVTSGADFSAGTYILSETGGPAGYEAAPQWVCQGSGQQIGPNQINLAPGQTATCTIINDDLPARLTVTKIVDNRHGGTLTVSDFPLFVDNQLVVSGVTNTFLPGTYVVSESQQAGYTATISGDCTAAGVVVLNLGDNKHCTITNTDLAPGLTLLKVVTNNDGGTATIGDFQAFIDGQPVPWGVAQTLAAGTYSLSETGPSGYQASAWSCQGGILVGNQVTITVGETVVCTIVNDDIPARLIVIKEVINDNGGTLTAADFTMEVLAGNGTFSQSFAGAGAPGVTLSVPAGDYTVDELPVVGYTKTLTADCAGSLTVGQTKTCIVTNDDEAIPPTKGTILVKKETNPAGNPQTFGFTATWGNFTLSHGQTHSSGLLTPGTYSVSENVPAGWQLTSATCNDGSPVNAIDLAAGEVVTCTFLNTQSAISTANLIVIKHVINNNGGTRSAADFTMLVTAQNPSQTSFAGAEAPGVTITVNPGSYSVDEADSFSYIKSRSADCDGTIAAGETKTCTITNDDPGGGGGCVGPNCGGGGGCTGAACNPNPSPVNVSITCGPNATLSFSYGSDVTAISVADNMSFSGGISISPVATLPWTIPAGNGHTVYVKFRRQTGSEEIRQATTNNCQPPGEVLSCVNLVTAEAELVKSPNQSLVNSVKGKLLLQTEAHGELWYVHYSAGVKYYLPGSPHTMTVVKALADGITNVNLFKIPLGLSQHIAGADTDSDNLPDLYEEAVGTNPLVEDSDGDGFSDYVEIQNGYDPLGTGRPQTDPAFAQQQAGRFFIQVESAGQVWYVNPTDGKRYYLPADSVNAYNVLANLAQGISNADIRQIEVAKDINGIDITALAGCYTPSPIVLGVSDELPRTGFPFDLAQLIVIPALAAYPWLKRRYSRALSHYFGRIKS